MRGLVPRLSQTICYTPPLVPLCWRFINILNQAEDSEDAVGILLYPAHRSAWNLRKSDGKGVRKSHFDR